MSCRSARSACRRPSTVNPHALVPNRALRAPAHVLARCELPAHEHTAQGGTCFGQPTLQLPLLDELLLCLRACFQQNVEDVLTLRRGVCQDYAHVMLGLCRTLRIPALYVSGYLATEIASATHAWVEVFIPGMGWQGLDPTHNCLPNENYVKIGVGRDYADVPPVSGTYKGTTERTMAVDVKISRRE